VVERGSLLTPARLCRSRIVGSERAGHCSRLAKVGWPTCTQAEPIEKIEEKPSRPPGSLGGARLARPPGTCGSSCASLGLSRGLHQRGIEDQGARLEIALDRRARLLLFPSCFSTVGRPIAATARARGIPRLCITACSLDHRRSLWSGAWTVTQF
jgi:hypothetical protein